MNGSAVTLDKVEIQISASAGAASENISHLSETLSELRSSIKGGFNSLSKLAESLTQLKASSKNLEEVSKNLQPIAKISSQLSSLAQITNPKGLEKTIDNLERLPSAFAKIDGKALSNVTRVSKELSSALTPIRLLMLTGAAVLIRALLFLPVSTLTSLLRAPSRLSRRQLLI